MHAEPNFRAAGRPRFSRPGCSNNDFGAARRTQTLALTNNDPVTADDLVPRIFPNVAKALRTLRVLERRKHVRRVGYVKIGRGLKILWAGFRVPLHKLEHEHAVSRLLFSARVHAVRRGSLVSPDYEFDAELFINGQLAFGLEYDSGQERFGQVERRMRKVAPAPVDVLWVVTSPSRLDRFIEIARSMGADTFLVALFDEALADFHGHIWHTADGSTTAIEHVPDSQSWLASICQPLR